MVRRPRFPRLVPSLLVSLVAGLTLYPAPGGAQVTLGFREEWPTAGNTENWGGGTNPTNPGAGGVLGPTDGYLQIAITLPGNFGANTTISPDYMGDWIAAGVTQIRFWLNDINTPEPFEIHLGIGSGAANFWQSNVGFVPPRQRWAPFVVNLVASNFTRTLGSGTFTFALQNVDRINIRHDLAPYSQFPDAIAGDLGIDHLLLTNGVVAVEPIPTGVARPIELAPPVPNPSRGPVTLSFRDPSGGPVSIRIVDAQGRLARAVELDAGAPGPRTWMWDGRDGEGRVLPAGAYRAIAHGAEGGTSRPLIRVR